MHENIGRYKILGKLGEGGMGIVYEGRDEALGRSVAIKVIRRDVADEVTRERMWREARAAASLNHPNICQVHEVGEDEGELFLAMELLQGESLAARMQGKQLPLHEAVTMATEILSAAEAIHDQGFVHRDLKPSNIHCTPHGIKLLDFGIVMQPTELMDEDGERLTRTGMLVGTPSFMAPEQWAGSGVGPAVDLFAIGAMLFEMIAGESAFRGENLLELYNAIARDPAPTLTGSPALEIVDRVVQRALAKQPADRPISAAAMAAELKTALPLIRDKEVARARYVRRLLILPFRLLQPDREIDFLGSSLADALVSSLSGRDDLIVKRGSAAHAVPDPDLDKIARETRVGLLLRGTLQRSGSRLRVSTQLVEVPEGTVSWSETKQTDMDDIFSLQDEVAEQITTSLSLRLSSTEGGISARDIPASGKAYEYFLRANQLSYNFAMLPAARDLYLSAIEEDPRFAPAWARLGRVYRVMAKYGHGGQDNLDLAQNAFLEALDLNPQLAVAHSLYAYYEIEELGRPQDAMARLLVQAHRAPNDSDLLAGLVVACRFCGLLDLSVEADRRARRLDPAVATSVAYTHWMRGDYQAAMLADDEDMGWIRHYSLPMLDRVEEAIASCRQREARSLQGVELDMLISTRSALEGDTATCSTVVQRVFGSSFHDPEGLYFVGRNAIRGGDPDLGHRILERIVHRGFSCVETFSRDPWLEPLRTDGRLQPLLTLAQQHRDEARQCYIESGGIPLLGPLVSTAT